MLDNELNTGREQMKTDPDLHSSHASTNQNNRERHLVIKPEPVDGRWSVRGLSKNVWDIMGRDPYNGDIYAFITKSRKAVHLLTEIDANGSMADLKLQYKNPIDWPDKKTDRKDEVVALTSKKKTDFLTQRCGIDYLFS
jgi:hypothetical protein